MEDFIQQESGKQSQTPARVGAGGATETTRIEVELRVGSGGVVARLWGWQRAGEGVG